MPQYEAAGFPIEIRKQRVQETGGELIISRYGHELLNMQDTQECTGVYAIHPAGTIP